jgi:hypothetical protein
MREGNLNSRTTPQGSPPEAARHSPSCSTGVLSDALWRILDFKFPSRSAPPSKQWPYPHSPRIRLGKPGADSA